MQVPHEADRLEPDGAAQADPGQEAGAEVAVTCSDRERRGERGMTTAEYAVGTVATVSFAGVLISVLTNPSIQQLLLKLIIFLLKLFWPDAPFL